MIRCDIRTKTTIALGTTVWQRAGAKAHLDGIGIYSRELSHALQPLFVSRDIATKLAAFGSIPSTEAAQICHMGPYFYFLYEVLKSIFLKKKIDCAKKGFTFDLFHATDHHIPALKNVPVIASVMDIIPFLHPEWTSGRLAWLKNWLFKQTILSADHVITISEYSKQDLMRHFGMNDEHISVTPLGVNPTYFEKIDPDTKQAMLSKYALQPGFFLFVGTLQPRKNLERALDAHALLPRAYQQRHPLVIVGNVGWKVDELLSRIKQGEVSGVVKWLKYLPEVEVRGLLQSALALLFVSLYEGFGLPVLEAFASGCPVIASNTTSIPEVAGDAAYLVDPLNQQMISEAMQRCIQNPDLCKMLKEKGLERVKLYSWEQCAKETLAVYLKVLKR